MKIGFDIRPLLDKHYSGVSLYTQSLLAALLRQDTRNDYRLFYNALRRQTLALPPAGRTNVSVTMRRYPNKLFNYGLTKLLNRPRLDKILNTDVLFLPHVNFAAVSRSYPYVVTVHDLSFLRHPHFFTGRQNLWHRALNIRKLLRNARRVITVSENTKRDVVELCHVSEQKVQVIYSGIDNMFRQLDHSDERFAAVRTKYSLPDDFILYLGNLEPRKNIESIIEAHALCRKRNPQLAAKLVIAGAPAWKHRVIHTMVRRSPYRGDIKLVGYIAPEEKPYLYNLARLFVFPSFYEGFGFPPLEAAGCGTPVVTSNVSSLPEVAGEFALLVNPYDVNELAHAMQAVVADEALRRELAAKGLRHVKRYSWDKCAREVLEVLQDVIQ